MAIAPSTAQTAAPPKVPLAAQEAIDKGVAAAKVPDYLQAIRYFEDARKLAPNTPIIYLNLGLAESRIPGRELRAIAWFAAYLAAYPGAPNAAAVNEQIGALDVRNQNNVSRLIKSVQDAASQLPGDVLDEALVDVADLWLDTGDMAAAMSDANLIKDSRYRCGVELYAVRVQLRDGDISSAQKIAERIQHTYCKANALGYIAAAKFEAGDSEGAKSAYAAALITSEGIDAENLWVGESGDGTKEDIAVAQAKSGDTASALKTADLIKDPNSRSRTQRSLADLQVNSGDIAGASKTLASAKVSGDLIEDADNKRWVLEAIVEAQAKVGVKKTQDQQATSPAKPANPPAIVVSDWLEQLDGDLNAGPFLDLASHLKSLPPSDNAWDVFEALSETTDTIVTAQIVIHRMLKNGR